MAKHRARKKADRIAEIDSDPQRTIAHLRGALEAHRMTISVAADKQRELMAIIGELRGKLADCERICEGLRRDRDLLNDETERFRDLMSGQLTDERVEEFFEELYEMRHQADEW